MNKNTKLIILVIILGIVGVLIFALSNKSKNLPEDETMNNKPVAQSHRSYEIEVMSNIANIEPNKPTKFVFKVKNDRGETLKDFELAHEKLMHFIVVRKDLQHFQHLHPDFNKETGEFSLDLAFPTNGEFRVFPDFTPAKSQDNPMSLPVTVHKDIKVGQENIAYEPVKASTTNKQQIGDYEVTYNFPTTLKFGEDVNYSLTIKRNGVEVKDLEVYLGALGHSVIVKEGDLLYIHTHALTNADTTSSMFGHEMHSTKSLATGPIIDFSTIFPEPGVYKIFTQFQHQGEVVTSEYVVMVN